MLLAQLTDTHIKAAGQPVLERIDTAAFLSAAIDHINAFRPAIDAVIVSGDVAEMGQADEYAFARSLFDRLEVPYYMVPGNHDDAAEMRAAFPASDHLHGGGAFIQYAIEQFPVRLVGLDTTVAGAHHGHLCEKRLAWLDQTLSEEPDKPTFIFMHHPAFDVGIRHMDAMRLDNEVDLFAVLERHPQIIHVACGHVHRPVQTSMRGIDMSIAPNGAHSITLDVAPDGPPAFCLEPPMLRLFWLGDQGTCATHLSPIGTFPPEVTF